jgi:hypothetical protein
MCPLSTIVSVDTTLGLAMLFRCQDLLTGPAFSHLATTGVTCAEKKNFQYVSHFEQNYIWHVVFQ